MKAHDTKRVTLAGNITSEASAMSRFGTYG